MSKLVLVETESKLPVRTKPTMIETIDHLERMEKRGIVIALFGAEIHFLEQQQARAQALPRAKAVRVTTLRADTPGYSPRAPQRAVSMGGNLVAIGRDRAAALSVALGLNAPVVPALSFDF
jgi:hypothetical protein